ncbi:MAG: aldehyde ferredoxin oxidoreductase family protein [Chloroflexi bacterium]|nr:aldehyde ferredoxin oxidoreductase family protein [Chloroflexota bacterium]
MPESGGWGGTVLHVDLTTGKIEKERPSLDWSRKFLGGRGFNSIRLFNMVQPDVDALSPENVLLFSSGPLVGTKSPACSRLTVSAKSPLTDIHGDANMGGFFGAEMKFAGYDQIVVTGKSERPVCIFIKGEDVKVTDASHVWGRQRIEAEEIITKDFGDPKARAVSIGPAGEKLVRIANVMSGPKRAAGRCGMGAVMGSKNLKAIVVRGNNKVAIARPDAFEKARKEAMEIMPTTWQYQRMHKHGTLVILDSTHAAGIDGVRNYSTTVFDQAQNIGAEAFEKDYIIGKRPCFGCPVACTHAYKVESGEFAGTWGEGPEFGMTGLGLKCEIGDAGALLKMNQLLNEYGIDCVSVQQMIAWVMDCYTQGLLDREDLDGLTPNFGDYHAAIELIHRIGKREGIGDILAEGEKRAPAIMKKGTEKYMHHVKGMSPVIEDPRAGKPFGLGYYTSSRGADHLRSLGMSLSVQLYLKETGQEMRDDIKDPTSEVGKGAAIKWLEDQYGAVDSFGGCKFVYPRCGITVEHMARLISAATGLDISKEELLQIGERVYNVEKAFNSRQGLTRRDDNFSVPDKFTKEPIKEGPFKDCVVDLDTFLDDYYTARGWDLKSGLPTTGKLAELGLQDIAAELARFQAVV